MFTESVKTGHLRPFPARPTPEPSGEPGWLKCGRRHHACAISPARAALGGQIQSESDCEKQEPDQELNKTLKYCGLALVCGADHSTGMRCDLATQDAFDGVGHPGDAEDEKQQ